MTNEEHNKKMISDMVGYALATYPDLRRKWLGGYSNELVHLEPIRSHVLHTIRQCAAAVDGAGHDCGYDGYDKCRCGDLLRKMAEEMEQKIT